MNVYEINETVKIH